MMFILSYSKGSGLWLHPPCAFCPKAVDIELPLVLSTPTKPEFQVTNLFLNQASSPSVNHLTGSRCREVFISFLREQRENLFVLQLGIRSISVSAQSTDPIFIARDSWIVSWGHFSYFLVPPAVPVSAGGLSLVAAGAFGSTASPGGGGENGEPVAAEVFAALDPGEGAAG
jgi:hypothetical protein